MRRKEEQLMSGQPSRGGTRFQVIASNTAAAELNEAECQPIIRDAIAKAQERDRGVHEGLVFSFDLRGKEWSIVVDLVERWVKILGKDELEQGIKEAVQKN
jgi:hypothetical protein